MDKDSIAVIIRARPLKTKKGSRSSYWDIRGPNIQQINDDNEEIGETYAFDEIYGPETSNSELYANANISQLVESAVNGFNLTIFAYGPTASGKTFTMNGTPEHPGIIPRVADDLFRHIQESGRTFFVRASYIEIYNEVIYDLLDKSNNSKDIKIWEDSLNNVVYNAKEIVLTNSDECLNVVRIGSGNRTIGQTKMNKYSSRSHSILRIILESLSSDDVENESMRFSFINLIDLAGSERVSQTQATGKTLIEGSNINKSLTVLGRVITQLTEKKDYINYRDSKLTRILSNSLGGNAKTLIICTVNLGIIDDTFYTLMFAQRAKRVKIKPKVNEIVKGQSESKRLMQESEQFKKLLENELKKNEELEKEKEKSSKKICELKTKILDLEQMFVTKQPNRANNIKVPKRRHTLGGQCFKLMETITEDCDTRLSTFSTVADRPKYSIGESPAKTRRFTSPEKMCEESSQASGLATSLYDELLELESTSATELWNTPKKQSCQSTPDYILRQRYSILNKEYTELQEFTKLEKKLKEELTEEDSKLRKSLILEDFYHDIKTSMTQMKEELLISKCLVFENKSNFTEKIDTLQNEISKLRKENELLIQKNTDWDMVTEAIKKKASSREKELLNQITELRSNSPNKTENNDFQKKIQTLSEENLELMERISLLEANIKIKENELFEAQDKLLETSEELDNQEKKNRELEKEVSKLKNVGTYSNIINDDKKINEHEFSVSEVLGNLQVLFNILTFDSPFKLSEVTNKGMEDYFVADNTKNLTHQILNSQINTKTEDNCTNLEIPNCDKLNQEILNLKQLLEEKSKVEIECQEKLTILKEENLALLENLEDNKTQVLKVKDELMHNTVHYQKQEELCNEIIDKLREEIQINQKENDILKENIEKLHLELSETTNKHNNIITELKRKLDLLEIDQNKINISSTKDVFRDITNEIDSIKLENKRNDNLKMANIIEKLEKEIENFNNELTTLKEENCTLSEFNKNYLNTINALEQKLQTLNNDKINNTESICSENLSDLNIHENKSHLQELIVENEQLKSTIDLLKHQIFTLNSNLKNCLNSLEMFNIFESNLEQFKSNKTDLNENELLIIDLLETILPISHQTPDADQNKEDTIKDLQNQLESSKLEVINLNQKLMKNIEQDQDNLIDKLKEELEDKVNQINLLNLNLEDSASNIKHLNEQIATLKNQLEIELENKSLINEELSKYSSDVKDLNEQIATLKNQLEVEIENKSQINEELSKYKSEHETYMEKLYYLSEEKLLQDDIIQDYKIELNQLKQKLKNIEDEEGNDKELLLKIETLQKHIDELQDTVKDYSEKLCDSEKTVNQLQSDLISLHEVKTLNDNLSKTLKDNEDALSYLNDQFEKNKILLHEFECNEKKLSQKLVETEEILNNLNKELENNKNLIDNYKDNEAIMTKKIKDKDELLSKLNNDLKNHEILLNEHKENDKKSKMIISDLNNNIEFLNEKQSKYENENSEYENKIKTLIEDNKVIQKKLEDSKKEMQEMINKFNLKITEISNQMETDKVNYNNKISDLNSALKEANEKLQNQTDSNEKVSGGRCQNRNCIRLMKCNKALESDINENSKQLFEKSKQLEELSICNQKLNTENKELLNEISELKSEICSLSDKHKDSIEQLERSLAREVAVAKLKEKDRQTLKEQLNALKKTEKEWQTYFNEIEKNLLNVAKNFSSKPDVNNADNKKCKNLLILNNLIKEYHNLKAKCKVSENITNDNSLENKNPNIVTDAAEAENSRKQSRARAIDRRRSIDINTVIEGVVPCTNCEKTRLEEMQIKKDLKELNEKYQMVKKLCFIRDQEINKLKKAMQA